LKNVQDRGANPLTSTKRRLMWKKNYRGMTMKNPLVQEVSKWMIRAYMVWSICADVFLLSGVVYLVFF
jgi:hypothetical protein